MSKALDPFIQVMKPVSPLAWMPLALYTIKDSSISAVFVIFICSLWPMLINTAFGCQQRPQGMGECRPHARGRHLPPCLHGHPAGSGTDHCHRHAHFPSAIAWLVIVAAEMLVGGTGIGYFVWNEWNNLSITNVITSILVIGLVGMLLDQALARIGRAVSFPE